MMTSAKFFFNIVKENRKQKIGIRLLSDMLFFVFTLSFFMREVYISRDNMLFGIRNMKVMQMTMLLAVLAGAQGYSYLLKAKTQDFYFSLPIKRSQLFFANYINGIVLYAVPMLLSQSVCFTMVKTVGGISDSSLNTYFFVGIVIQFLAYLFFYQMTILAMQLSGNGIVAAGWIAVFCFYIPILLDEVITPLCSLFFRTFYKSEWIEGLKSYLSPINLYEKMNGMEQSSPLFPYLYEMDRFGMAVLIVGNVILFGLCFAAQKKRKAEAAGSGLAFQKMETFLHMIIDIPAAVLTGRIVMTFVPSSYRIVGGSIASLFGWIFSYGMLEILLQMRPENLHKFREFSKIFRFAGKGKFVVTELGVVAAVWAVFSVGASFYDNYVPKENQFQSVRISIDGLDKKGNVDLTERRLRATKLTGETGKKTCDWLKKEILSFPNFLKEKEKTERLTEVTAAYELKDGRTIYRKYPIYTLEQIEAFDGVYTTEQYKAGIYEAFSYKDYEEMEIVWTNEIEHMTLDLHEKELEKFLNTLLEEVTGLSIRTLEQEFPIGRLRIINEAFEKETSVYLYPSFTKTIAYLKHNGVPVEKTAADYEVLKVEITSYGSYGEEEQHSFLKEHDVYTEAEEIQKVLEHLVCEEYVLQPVLNPADALTEIKVRVKDGEMVRTMNAVRRIVNDSSDEKESAEKQK